MISPQSTGPQSTGDSWWRRSPVITLGLALGTLTPLLVQDALAQRRGPLPFAAVAPEGMLHDAGIRQPGTHHPSTHAATATESIGMWPQLVIAVALAVPLVVVLLPAGLRVGMRGRRRPDSWPAWVGGALGAGLAGAATGAGIGFAVAAAVFAPSGPVTEVVLVSATAMFRYGVLLGLIATVLATVPMTVWSRPESRT